MDDEMKVGIYCVSWIAVLLVAAVKDTSTAYLIASLISLVYITILIYAIRMEKQEQANRKRRSAIKQYCHDNLPEDCK